MRLQPCLPCDCTFPIAPVGEQGPPGVPGPPGPRGPSGGSIGTIGVLNVEELRAFDTTQISNYGFLATTGYYTSGDGGEALYYYLEAATDTDDGGSVIAPDSGVGRFFLHHSGTVNLKQFGAKIDGTYAWYRVLTGAVTPTDDTAAVQAAIDYASASGAALFQPPGFCRIAGILTISKGWGIVWRGHPFNYVTLGVWSVPSGPFTANSFLWSVLVRDQATGPCLIVRGAKSTGAGIEFPARTADADLDDYDVSSGYRHTGSLIENIVLSQRTPTISANRNQYPLMRIRRVGRCTFRNIAIYSADAFGLEVGGADDSSFERVFIYFNGNTYGTNGMRIRRTIPESPTESTTPSTNTLHFLNCDWEGNRFGNLDTFPAPSTVKVANAAGTGITAVGVTVTVVSATEHAFQVLDKVRITGATTAGFNQTGTVATVTDAYNFTVTVPVAVGAASTLPNDDTTIAVTLVPLTSRFVTNAAGNGILATGVGLTLQIVTTADHGFGVGDRVEVFGATTAAYNVQGTVTSVLNKLAFIMTLAPADVIAGVPPNGTTLPNNNTSITVQPVPDSGSINGLFFDGSGLMKTVQASNNTIKAVYIYNALDVQLDFSGLNMTALTGFTPTCKEILKVENCFNVRGRFFMQQTGSIGLTLRRYITFMNTQCIDINVMMFSTVTATEEYMVHCDNRCSQVKVNGTMRFPDDPAEKKLCNVLPNQINNTSSVLLGELINAKLTVADQNTEQIFDIRPNKYRIDYIVAVNPSMSMATAAGGIFKEPGKVTAIVADTQVYTSLVNYEDNLKLTLTTAGAKTLTHPHFHFHLDTGQALGPVFTALLVGTATTGLIKHAIITTTAVHGYATGNIVNVSGATPAPFNGRFAITVLNTLSFTYEMLTSVGGVPGTPIIPTGPISIELVPTVDFRAYGDILQ